jgi:hypothetical protein
MKWVVEASCKGNNKSRKEESQTNTVLYAPYRREKKPEHAP